MKMYWNACYHYHVYHVTYLCQTSRT